MTYDEQFYLEEGRVAAESAAPVADWYMATYPDTRTVIDVGCGTGEWAWAFQQRGCHVIGVDAHSPRALHVIGVLPVDLADGYPCDGYDLAICLEVAEHLPDISAVPLVTGLAKANKVLFSAATPGQPGIGHVNCQPHEYWHDLFAAWNMTYTHVGPTFSEPVADFYRRNMFLYSREDS